MRTIAIALVMLAMVSFCHAAEPPKPKVQGYAKQPVREPLDRGLIARPMADGKVYLGWRLLDSDPKDAAFNVYRRTGDGQPVKLNPEPIRRTTDFVDESAPQGKEHAWSVRPVLDGKEVGQAITGTVAVGSRPLEGAVVVLEPKGAQKVLSVRATTDKGGRFEAERVQPGRYRVTIAASASGAAPNPQSPDVGATPGAAALPYIPIKLDGNYTFQKVGIADLDGDGRYDFVLKQPSANIDPWYKYWTRSPDTYKLEAYRSDGKFLWRFDLGWAIERGIWYSPYVVYDLDGDGKAEVAVKTGEGDPRDPDGKVTKGPEYLTILDGLTGKPRVRVDWPSREGFEGEHGYNYASRNQLGVAYLDGKTPCLIVERGTYNRIKVVACEFHGGQLRELWQWDNKDLPRTYWGQGAHWMHAADVDADGRDEVLLGSAVLDDDGNALWSTGLGHPDHFYVGDIDPSRPGLEIYYGIETRQRKGNGMCLVDARTGKILWGIDQPTQHVHGHGLCSDIDAAHPGSECYSAESDPARGKSLAWALLHDCKGSVLSREPLDGFGPRCAYWDADLQREIVRSRGIFDYGSDKALAKLDGSFVAVADVLGDWREEIITSVPGELRIYTTTIPAADRRPCLMQDRLYRMDVVAAAMGYYQVPMTSFDLSAAVDKR